MRPLRTLAQETLAHAWEALPTLREPGAFLPWLKTIAGRACLNWHRAARPETLPLESAAETPDRHGLQPLPVLLARERGRALRRALAELPDANRLALLMHVREGASYQQIADFTGVAVTTVEGRISRARVRLRRLLRDDEDALFDKPARRGRPRNEGGTDDD